MFWDKISGLYVFFEKAYNGKVYKELGKRVAEEIEQDDIVLECACGPGSISKHIANRCRKLIATDFSTGMLKQAAKNCKKYSNMEIKRADIMHLKCSDGKFDKVVAGNVIHLLDEPYAALKELERVCKTGGKIIIPTYVNAYSRKTVKLYNYMGADFKREFDIDSYKEFFEKAGYKNIEYFIIKGKMPCAIAIITKQ